ncbi:orotidine-5'-phosphate decarboxylase [bacterium]|nr:orotidine-5'-phosphate decarboxylase [bacterium]
MTFLEKLAGAVAASNVCVGLDPVPEKLPDHLAQRRDGIALFCEAIVEATAPFTAAYKPNLAFFEALGIDGWNALERAVAAVRRYAPDAVIIGDGKRNDIGNTARLYARAMFDTWGFDAATVNPYLGSDGILPFLQFPGRGIFVLALTSNGSAGELQDHTDNSEPLYLHVARLAQEEWNDNGNVGLVVGATKGGKIREVGEAAPDLPFLLPGIGAQGGDLEKAVHAALGPNRPPGLINSSRGILYGSNGREFDRVAAEAAKTLRDQIQAAKKTGTDRVKR